MIVAKGKPGQDFNLAAYRIGSKFEWWITVACW